MLIRRRIGRIWGDFFHKMAVFMGLSALFFFCGSVFRVSTNSEGGLESENLDSAVADRSYEDNGAVALGLQRHNRVLQFMDLQKYRKSIFEGNKVTHQNNIQGNSNSHQKFFTPSSVESGIVISQNQESVREINLETVGTFNSLTYPKEQQDPYLNRANPARAFPAVSINRARIDFNQFSSRFVTPVSRYKKNQTDSVQLLQPGRNNNVGPDFNSSALQVKRLPKAIIIGAKKAGTRALLEFLRLHPKVEGTGPEPHFFDRNYNKGLEWYRDLMPRTQNSQITIEKTPGYFVTHETPKRIFEMDPTIKLILVVRDPVTRAISDYCQAVSKHAMKPFEEMALLDERLGLVNTSWGAIKIGVYAKHMEHWLQVFSLQQIHLVDGQKLIEEPAREVAKVETFLGLPRHINESHFYLRGFKGTFPCLIRDGKPHCLDEKTKGRDHPVVKESVLQRLRDFYRPFNAKFYQMVGRNFEWS